LGAFGLMAGTAGILGVIACVLVATYGLTDQWPRSAFFLVSLAFVFSIVSLLIGVQAFLAGLLAEFALARTATDEPYRVAESLPEPPGAR
jgi:hypothetical protein